MRSIQAWHVMWQLRVWIKWTLKFNQCYVNQSFEKKNMVKEQPRLEIVFPNPDEVQQIPKQNPPKKHCCSRKFCFIGTALGVFFGLLIIGTITYLLMVHESQCYRGCHRVCDSENQHDCRADCWKVCWRAQWSKCPEHGAKVCAYTLVDKTMVNILD